MTVQLRFYQLGFGNISQNSKSHCKCLQRIEWMFVIQMKSVLSCNMFGRCSQLELQSTQSPVKERLNRLLRTNFTKLGTNITISISYLQIFDRCQSNSSTEIKAILAAI